MIGKREACYLANSDVRRHSGLRHAKLAAQLEQAKLRKYLLVLEYPSFNRDILHGCIDSFKYYCQGFPSK